MTTTLLPELKLLRDLLTRMKENTGSEAALISSVNAFAELTENGEQAPARMFQLVSRFTQFADEGFADQGSKQIAVTAAKRVSALFGAKELSRPSKEYATSYGARIEVALEMLPIFENLKFDSGKLIEKRDEIQAEIDKLRGAVAKSSELSDSSKSIVDAQLKLIEKSLQRFETEGVGPFRESIFCAIGRITIEMKGHDDVKIDGVAVVDWIIRISDLAQITGTLLLLANAGAAMKLLTGPAS